MKKEHMYLLAGILAGVIFAGQIRQLPVVNKLPAL